MQWKWTLVLVAAAGFAASHAGIAAAQQSQSRKPAPQAQQKEYFDMYEPARRLRLRRETCASKEQPSGAFCVKACKTGYGAMTGAKTPRCRSLTPLPAGQFPGAVRREMDSRPRVPPRAAKSGNPKQGW